MTSPPNLVLAGFMGTGKSTAGAMVAARLCREFIDTDALVEAAAGMAVKDIFATRGEAAFRALEAQACLLVADRGPCVIATGGGALLDLISRRALEATGVIVLLTCERAELLARLAGSAGGLERPLLGGDPVERIDRLLESRQALYASVPLQVDTTHLTPEKVAGRVLALYSRAARERTPACAL